MHYMKEGKYCTSLIQQALLSVGCFRDAELGQDVPVLGYLSIECWVCKRVKFLTSVILLRHKLEFQYMT